MAVAVAKFGWLLGSVVMVLLLAMNVHISILVWRVRMGLPEAHTYAELARFTFGSASRSVQSSAAKVVEMTQYTFLMAMLGLYALAFGRGGMMILYGTRMCLPMWTLVGCMVILPFFASSRNLGDWSSLIWLNVSTILGTIIIPLIVMFRDDYQDSRPEGSVFVPVADMTASGVLLGLNTMTFAMTSQFMLVEIIDEMKDPQEFPKAYSYFSAPFQLIAFMIVGLGGYYFTGDAVTGMIGDNIAFGVGFQLAAICLVVHMLVTFMIKAIVLARAVHGYVSPTGVDDNTWEAWQTWTTIACGVSFLSWLVANVVPFFSDLVDLLGATMAPIGCYVIPIVLYLRFVHDRPGTGPGLFEGLLITLEMALSLVLMVAGTYVACRQIADKWHTYGPPFHCHCEDVWNNCACSATHVGMEEMCAASPAVA